MYLLKGGVNMNTEKKEDLMKENTNAQVEEIADLTVTDEQARQAIGGATPKLMEALATGQH